MLVGYPQAPVFIAFKNIRFIWSNLLLVGKLILAASPHLLHRSNSIINTTAESNTIELARTYKPLHPRNTSAMCLSVICSGAAEVKRIFWHVEDQQSFVTYGCPFHLIWRLHLWCPFSVELVLQHEQRDVMRNQDRTAAKFIFKKSEGLTYLRILLSKRYF